MLNTDLAERCSAMSRLCHDLP